jgi:hypothetical protein
MMVGRSTFWKRKSKFDDAAKDQLIKAISFSLEIQTVAATGHSIEDAEGWINRKAIGHIYGFVDAALTRYGQDMSDPSIGVPITYQVIGHLFPGCEERYTRFLLDDKGKDTEVALGIMKGGQQFTEFRKPDAK